MHSKLERFFFFLQKMTFDVKSHFKKFDRLKEKSKFETHQSIVGITNRLVIGRKYFFWKNIFETKHFFRFECIKKFLINRICRKTNLSQN